MLASAGMVACGYGLWTVRTWTLPLAMIVLGGLIVRLRIYEYAVTRPHFGMHGGGAIDAVISIGYGFLYLFIGLQVLAILVLAFDLRQGGRYWRRKANWRRECVELAIIAVVAAWFYYCDFVVPALRDAMRRQAEVQTIEFR